MSKLFDLLEDAAIQNTKRNPEQAKILDFYIIQEKVPQSDENGVPTLEAQVWSSPKGQEPKLPEGYIVVKKIG